MQEILKEEALNSETMEIAKMRERSRTQEVKEGWKSLKKGERQQTVTEH